MLPPLDRRAFLAALGGVIATACGGSGTDDATPGSSTTLSSTNVSSTTVSSTTSTTVPSTGTRPNVLYITADDLGTRLSVYDHPVIRTPNLERFAESALIFDDCHCQSAICGPSRASILTGLRPETTGINANTDPWRDAAPDAVTMPRHFRDAGYHTRRIGKIEDLRNGELDDAWDTVARPGTVERIEPVVEFLEELAADVIDQPYFAAIGFAAPHCPWPDDDDARTLYPDDAVREELGPGRTVPGGYLARCAPDRYGDLDPAVEVELTDDEAITLARGYLTEITELDSMVGTVLETAEELGLLDNTIVIFWSGDHGYALGDHGVWGKWVPRGAISRIPLLMQLPSGLGAGARTPALVEALDMYPTLVELCGLPTPPQGFDGVSFAPLFADPTSAAKAHVFTRHGRQSGVSDGRWNLVHDDFFETDVLFDRVTDPDELVDVVAEHPDVAAGLLAALDGLPTVLRGETFAEALAAQNGDDG